MNVLVVDDEDVARSRLTRLLRGMPGVTVVGEASNGEEAIRKVAALEPDVVMLDIQMPGLDGLAVAARLTEAGDRIHVIFVTAYHEHAVRAFEASAVDYLLKPIERRRLQVALAKAERLRALEQREQPIQALLQRLVAETDPPRIVAKRGKTLRVFEPHCVSRLHARDSYTLLREAGQEFVIDESITSLEARLAPLGFMRVHRSELVNLKHIRALRRDDDVTIIELVDGQCAVVSRRELSALKERLGLPPR